MIIRLLKTTSKLAITSLFIVLCLSACATTRPPIDIPDSPPPATKMEKPPQIALVLGGGGARGYAHVGVLDALTQAGIPIDLIVGASVGSIVGAVYADNADPKHLYDTMMNAGFWDFADVSAGFSGFVSGSRLEHYLLKHIKSRNFRDLRTKLVIATTDLTTGETVALESGAIAPAVLASSALPGVVQPVHLYGRTLVDGGVADPVPVELAKKYNPKIIIAVDISQQLSKNVAKHAGGILERSYDIMWRKFAEHSERNADIVIHPSVGNTNIFDLRQKQKLYLAGFNATKKVLPQIKALMAGG